MRVNKVIFVMMFVVASLVARADSFTSLEILQPDGSSMTLSPTAMNTFTWTFAPNEIAPGSSAYAAFFFPLDAVSATFTSTLSIDGFSTDIFSTLLDATLCGSDPCYGIAALVLPRFYGMRQGSVTFTFGDKSSATYHFGSVSYTHLRAHETPEH